MTYPASTEATKRPGPRRATRVSDGAWLGGVATGIAQHLGWSVLTVRWAFVILGLSQFLGIVVYGVLWTLLPSASTAEQAPGLTAGERTGMRGATSSPARRSGKEIGALIALIIFGLGMLWLLGNVGAGVSREWFWPIALACAGIAMLWRQADTFSQTHHQATPKGWYAGLVAGRGWFAVVRITFGLLLVGLAIVVVVAQEAGIAYLPQTLLVMLLVVVGIGLVVAPWAYRLRQQLNDAREARIVSDARADMAAHLHDSVLQTLALIQRQADDPKSVASLARRQERELRTYLYGETPKPTHLKAALMAAAQEVEDERGIPVELVTVGDCELTDTTQQLVKATREAIVNAAKHSGAPLIDVYAEVSDDLVEVFIRDRGHGFDLGSIGEDRMGVRKSIIDRMERHGGKAIIRSAPGEGTEVRLEMSR